MCVFLFCTGRIPICLGRHPFVAWVALVVVSGFGIGKAATCQPPDVDQNARSDPHPWIQSAPPAILRLIDKGRVRLSVDDDRLRAANKQALTYFRFDVDYRYRFDIREILAVSGDPSRRRGTVVARLRLQEVGLEHTVVLPSRFQPSQPWEAPLIQHEFDHVSISTDPRFLKIAKEVFLQPIRFPAEWSKAQGPDKDIIDQRIKEEVSARITELERIVQSNYDALDRISKDGQANLPDRSRFFLSLFSGQQLEEVAFKYLDSIRIPAQDTAKREVLDHYLSLENP
jgi:hypothetical protein